VKEYLKRMLTDNSGNTSSMRLIFVLTGVTFIPCLVVVWTAVSLYNREISDIPGGVVELLGTLLVGKSLQKGVEVYGEIKKNSLDIDPPK
jgi:hypothetical protein